MAMSIIIIGRHGRIGRRVLRTNERLPNNNF